MKSFTAYADELTALIKDSYENGVTLEEAERLAGKFLHAQIQASNALKLADLDARMRKSGVKAIKAAVYLEGATKDQKKPSDVYLSAQVDSDKLVMSEQEAYDTAEVNRDELERYYNIFKEAHVHFRTIARGKYE